MEKYQMTEQLSNIKKDRDWNRVGGRKQWWFIYDTNYHSFNKRLGAERQRILSDGERDGRNSIVERITADRTICDR